jgi:O-antigen/teichoic acid export membrane protein
MNKFNNGNANFSKHLSRYALGNVLALGAGFVSFPVTTRLLDSAQFGILSYFDTYILILAAILKFGCGDTLVRFYPHGGSEQDFVRFWSSLLVAPVFIGLAIWLFIMLIISYLALQGSLAMPTTVFLALFQTIFAVLFSHFLWVSRTREQSKFNAVIDVASKWSTVALIVFILLVGWKAADGVFTARVIVLAIFNIALFIWLGRQIGINIRAIDWALTWQGLRYGIPLAMGEISSIVLGLIDRIMLKHHTGDFSAVGIYSIGFGLASYFDQVIANALAQAITPVAGRLYATEGAASVVHLKKTVLKNLLYIAGALISFLMISGRDLLLMLAGPDKIESAKIFVVAATFFSIIPIFKVMAIGLLLDKRSDLHFFVLFASAAITVVLNYISIPIWGALGACFSTCLTLAGMNLALYLLCPQPLRCAPSLESLIKVGTAIIICVSVMFWTRLFGFSNHWARVLVAFFMVLILYGGFIILIDKTLKNQLRKFLIKH